MCARTYEKNPTVRKGSFCYLKKCLFPFGQNKEENGSQQRQHTQYGQREIETVLSVAEDESKGGEIRAADDAHALGGALLNRDDGQDCGQTQEQKSYGQKADEDDNRGG